MAIDTLTYKFEVMREDPADVKEGPDDGIYCHGLWLEGERDWAEVIFFNNSLGTKRNTSMWPNLLTSWMSKSVKRMFLQSGGLRHKEGGVRVRDSVFFQGHPVSQL